MSKDEAKNAIEARWARIVIFWQSFSLTWDERALMLAVLLSLLVGAVVMHWRREYLLSHPMAAPSPTASPTPAKKHDRSEIPEDR